MRRVLRGLGIASAIVLLITMTAPAAIAGGFGGGGGHGGGGHFGGGSHGGFGGGFHQGFHGSRPGEFHDHHGGFRDHDHDFFFGVGFGFPIFWDGWWWGDPFFWGPWYPPYPALRMSPGNLLPVDVSVKPHKAQVILDGHDVGEARDFDSYAHPLLLTPGTHVVEFRYPGYRSLRVEIGAEQAVNTGLSFRLRKGTGTDEINETTPVAPEQESQQESQHY